MIFKSFCGNGSPFGKTTKRVLNRLGSAVAVGDVLALDVVQSDGSTQAGTGRGSGTTSPIEAGYDNAVLPNCHASAMASTDNPYVLCTVEGLLGGEGADDTEIEVCLFGRTRAFVTGTNFTSGLIGDRLMLNTTNNDTSFNIRTLIAHAVNANLNRPAIAQILTAVDASGGRQLTDVFFWGGLSFMLTNTAS